MPVQPEPTCGVSIALRAFYTTSELAQAANVDIDFLRRLLKKNGVVFIRAGRSLVVPLTEIENKVFALWESLKLAQSLQSAAI